MSRSREIFIETFTTSWHHTRKFGKMISKSRYRYMENFDISASDMIRYDISISNRYFDISKHHYRVLPRSTAPTDNGRTYTWGRCIQVGIMTLCGWFIDNNEVRYSSRAWHSRLLHLDGPGSQFFRSDKCVYYMLFRSIGLSWSLNITITITTEWSLTAAVADVQW